MPGNLGLALPQNFYEEADANLLFSHEVEQTETSIVAKGLKEELDVKC